MNRQRSSGKKGPADPVPPPQHQQQQQPPLQQPPQGRMSLAQLKKQANQQKQPHSDPIPPPTPTTPQQIAMTLSQQTTLHGTGAIGGISSMNVSKGKLNEDGRRSKIDNLVPTTPFKSQHPKTSEPCPPTPAKIHKLHPLPLYTHPTTLPLKFDKFLKLEKNSVIGGQLLSYPIIGLSQYDSARMGLISNDLVVITLIEPSDWTSASHLTSPHKTPTKPIQLEPFKHQHPSFLSPTSPFSTPNTKSTKPTPLLTTPTTIPLSHTTVAANKSYYPSNNPYLTAPTGTHHHMCICKVQIFSTIDRGQTRLDIQFKSTLNWFPFFHHYIYSRLLPDISPDLYHTIDFETHPILQAALGTPAKRDEFEKGFFSDFQFYITTIKHSSQLVTNTDIIQHQNNVIPYPRIRIEVADVVYMAKNNILLTPQQELSFNIAQQKSKLSQAQGTTTSASTLDQSHSIKSIPNRLSQSLDTALSSSLNSNNVLILPNAPICISVCGVYRPYYPYHVITQSKIAGGQQQLQQSNTITVYTTTPRTATVTTLGMRTFSSTTPQIHNLHDDTLLSPHVTTGFKSTPFSKQRTSELFSIAGLDHEMNILTETLELPLKQPTLFSSFGLKPPKGVLLYGPPGCGKTLLAHWFSSVTSAHFIPLTATNILARGGASYLYQLFTSLSTTQRGEVKPLAPIGPLPLDLQAQKLSQLSQLSSDSPPQFILPDGKIPVIIFIDEIDGLCSDNTIVCALLSLLDGGHETFSNICILGATNRPSVIPAALRRPGRFDVELNITPPSIQAREEILKAKLIKNEIQHKLSAENITSIAEHANGYVGADIDLLISEAISHNVLTAYGQSGENQNDGTQSDGAQNDGAQNDGTGNKQDIHALNLANFHYALQIIRPSGLRDYTQISVADSEVGGHHEIKQRLEEAFEWPLRHAQLVDALGARKSSGILLFGPPGCAKTLLAKSICARSRRTFLSVKGPELFSKYVGDSEKAVRAVFQRARACAPCILFLDEVDSFGSARGGSGGGDATDRVVSQLLVEMDGIGDRGDVCVLAATNRPDMVDPALLRAGRLDRSLYVGPPDQNETRDILNITLKKISACDPKIFTHLDHISQICYNKRHTGAELAAICRDASVRALTRYITAQEIKLKELELDMKTLTTDSFLDMINDLNHHQITSEQDVVGSHDRNNDNNSCYHHDNISPADSQTLVSADQMDACVSLHDLYDAVNHAVPRITPNMIKFYVDYQQRHGLTNL